MKYEIVTLDEKVVIGKSIRTTNENGKSMIDIGKVWQEFNAQRLFESIENRINTKAIGLYTEYEGDASKPYTFICGCEVSNVNEDELLEKRVINEGKYAKFTIKGHIVNDVAKAWFEIWNMDLDRKYDSDFELYHNDSDDMTNQTIELFISLK